MRLRAFNVIDRDFAEVNFKNVYLQDAVDGFKFSVQGDIEPVDATKASGELMDLSAVVSLGNKYLCELRPNSGSGFIWQGRYKGSVHLEGFLRGGALEEMESFRQLNDLQLNVGLRGLISFDRPGLSLTSSDGKPLVGTHTVSGGQEVITFPRSVWENTLLASGYGKLIHFALSLPAVKNSQDAQDAYRRLGEAQKALVHGSYRNAIETCRVALVGLRKASTVELKDKDLFSKAAGDLKNLSEPERVALVRAAVLCFAQDAPHPGEVVDAAEPSYGKAAASIYLTALTAWLEEQRGQA